MRALNSLSQELFDWITKNGHGEYIGTDGRGHVTFRLANGAEFHTSTTPSKYTAVANAKAAIRRQLGIKSDSPNAAKYRHVKTEGYDGRKPHEGGGWDTPREVKAWREEVESIDSELVTLNPRRDSIRVRNLAARRVYLADRLGKYGVIADLPNDAA